MVGVYAHQGGPQLVGEGCFHLAWCFSGLPRLVVKLEAALGALLHRACGLMGEAAEQVHVWFGPRVASSLRSFPSSCFRLTGSQRGPLHCLQGGLLCTSCACCSAWRRCCQPSGCTRSCLTGASWVGAFQPLLYFALLPSSQRAVHFPRCVSRPLGEALHVAGR